MNNEHRDRQFYNERFLEDLQRLNPAQRTAVENIDGPMLVIAGPGTGKTHMLSARIGWILLKTDTQAHNILCLTFTEAGVRAMRKRLLQFIGPEAYRIHIYTFHSFCNTIIRDNLELFGRRGLEPLSELERIDLIRKLIDELPNSHLLKRGKSDVYFYEHHLFSLFRQMKSENWTPQSVNSAVEAYLKSLPNRKDFIYQINRGNIRKGEVKKAQLQAVTRRMEQLNAAAKLYPRYLELMKQAKRYDYDDMILWVLSAFDKYPALLRSYQERYLYFLVDEYQDTNGAQNQIIRKLVEYWDNPNLFIVGDDDQSIFEFQGARLKNLLDFYKDYEKRLSLVLLTYNYRSTQAILDSANQLIRLNEKRVVHAIKEQGIEKTLTAKHPEYQLSVEPIFVNTYQNRLQETIGVIEKIQQLKTEGVPLEEIGVLYARHRQADQLIALLEKKEIPFYIRKEINVLEVPVVQMLRTILTYLALESRQAFSGEHLLFKILHFEFLDIVPTDLARISLKMATLNWQERPKWREILDTDHWLNHFGIKNLEAFQNWRLFLKNQLIKVYSTSLSLLVEGIINQSGLLRYVNDQPDRQYLIQVLGSFMNFIKQERDRNPKLNLSAFLEVLAKMDANRIDLPLQRTLVSEQGVQLLTAHSAKGLEFEHVFMIDCVKDYWEPSTRRNNYRFSLPDTLTYSGEEDAMEARRRLFFVAMTRAKKGLEISYSLQNEQSKDLEHALFIDELRGGQKVVFREMKVDADLVLDNQLLRLTEKKNTLLASYEQTIIQQLVDEFVLSISALNSYLKCPLGFFYEHLLQVPVQFSEAALFGTAVHNSLQRLFDQMLANKNKAFPGQRVFERLFRQEMQAVEGGFSEKSFLRKMDEGKQQLVSYYKKYKTNWPKKTKTELVIRNIEWNGVPITGIIDRVDLLKKREVRIIDYKTGNPDFKKVRPPSNARPHGSPYWRQLYFYKLLLEQSNLDLGNVKTGVISFLSPNPNGELLEESLTYNSEGMALIKKLVVEVHTKIKNLDFEPGCGKPNCPWCEFFNKKNKVETFAQAELESLDDI